MSKMSEISREFLRSNIRCEYSFLTWPNLRDSNMFHPSLLYEFANMNREYLRLGLGTRKKKKAS